MPEHPTWTPTPCNGPPQVPDDYDPAGQVRYPAYARSSVIRVPSTAAGPEYSERLGEPLSGARTLVLVLVLTVMLGAVGGAILLVAGSERMAGASTAVDSTLDRAVGPT